MRVAHRARRSSKRRCWLAPTARAAGCVARYSALARRRIGRALMTDIAVDPERTPEFIEAALSLRLPMREPRNQRLQLVVSVPDRRRPHLNVGIYDQHPHEFVETGGEQVADDSGSARGVSRTSARRLEAARDAMAIVSDSMVRRARQLCSRARDPRRRRGRRRSADGRGHFVRVRARQAGREMLSANFSTATATRCAITIARCMKARWEKS